MSNVATVDICNYALAIVGQVAQANVDFLETYDGTPTDQSALPAMGWMQRLYPMARRYSQLVLRPQECLKYAAPGAALSSSSAMTVPGWTYVFQGPTDCLAFHGVVVSSTIDLRTGKETFLPYLEIYDQIACNYDDGILFKYTREIEDTTKFSEPLIMVIAHRLAYLAARPMGIDAPGRQAILTEFKSALAEARSLQGNRAYLPTPERTLATAHYRNQRPPTTVIPEIAESA